MRIFLFQLSSCLLTLLLSACSLNFTIPQKSEDADGDDGTDIEISADQDTTGEEEMDVQEDVPSDLDQDPDAADAAEDFPAEDAAKDECPDCEDGPPNDPPTVLIMAPENDTVLAENDAIVCSVMATDTDGFVVRVELLIDDTVVSTSDSPTLTWTWDPAEFGRHVLTAEAEDNGGAFGTSEEVNVSVYRTAAYREGALPSPAYLGAMDVDLAEDYPDSNFGSASDLEADGGGTVDNVTPLLLWTLDGIASDATVIDARLTLFPEDYATGSSLYGVYAVLKPWVENQATWNRASASLDWEVPGCQGATDRESAAVGTVIQITLDPIVMATGPHFVEVVQRWVSDPTTNHGVVIQDFTVEDGFHVYSSQYSDASMRPLLEVMYVR